MGKKGLSKGDTRGTVRTSYGGSPIAGQYSLFPEHTGGNGKRPKPDIEDVKLFLKKNKANRIALKGNAQYPGGNVRSPECVTLPQVNGSGGSNIWLG